MKYVFLVHRRGQTAAYFHVDDPQAELQSFEFQKSDHDNDYLTFNSVFTYDARGDNVEQVADGILRQIATANPGCEVEMFRMEKAGHVAPGEFSGKRVDADGSILPII